MYSAARPGEGGASTARFGTELDDRLTDAGTFVREVCSHRQQPARRKPEPNYMGKAYQFELVVVLRAVLQYTGTLSASSSNPVDEDGFHKEIFAEDPPEENQSQTT